MKILTLLFLLTGCSSIVVIREVAVQDPMESWAKVLKKYVDDRGRIDFVELSKARSDLESYVSYVARVSPRSHPQEFAHPGAPLAYYLNAYNALAMYNVLHFDIPPDNASFFKRFRFFYLTKYKIGGEAMALYDLENDIIRPFDDPRIHVALNCMVRGCPRLPQAPFDPKNLEEQLDAQAKEFFNEARNVQVLNDKRTVRLSEILDFFTGDFLKQSPTLIAYVNRYRKEKIPEDYEVEFIDYDWTTNSQSLKQQVSSKKLAR